MTELSKRKNTLKRILKKHYSESTTLAYLLISTGKLDNVIKKINEKDDLLKNNSLSSEKQFIEVLLHLIRQINNTLWFLNEKNTIIEYLLNCDEALPILLSTKRIGNNEFIPFFEFHTKKLLICNFYKVLKFIDRSDKINRFLTDNKLNIDELNINNQKDIEKILEVFKLICLCNQNSFRLFYAFDNNINVKIRDMLKNQIEILIENTISVQDQAKSFLSILSKMI